MSRFPHRFICLAQTFMFLALTQCGTDVERTEPKLDGLRAHQDAQQATCDFSGTWAMQFRIPIAWAGSAGLQSGEGEIVQWSLSEREHTQEDQVIDTLRPCGSSVPGYRSQRLFGNTLYGTRFPDSLFDRSSFRDKRLTTRLTGSTAGSAYQSELLSIELGIAMRDPLHDLWPQATAEILALAEDQDDDGHPGITVEVTGERDDAFPPLGMLLGRARHARRFYVATRNLAMSEGKVATCDRFEGSATIPMLGGKPALNNRILGCETTDGGECTAAEANFVAKWQPEYQLLGHSIATLVRVPTGTTCAEVRALNFRAR